MNQNENSAPKRENFASRLGFLLVSAGCAIGIGNVWRFPTVAGQNGGGVFVLFYLIFLLAMGVPVLTMELAVGARVTERRRRRIARWKSGARSGICTAISACSAAAC